MNADYYNLISNCTCYRKDREKNRNLALRNPEFLNAVLEIAFNPNDKANHNACWILELICERKLKTIVPYLDGFCDVLPKLKNDSAIRPMSKICLFIAKSNHRSNGIKLTQHQETQILEVCLDWLIGDEKVATKATSIKTLFVLGKKYDWVHNELKTIIEQGYSENSAAYKAVTRNILKKIDR
jgi:hypothetical protein